MRGAIAEEPAPDRSHFPEADFQLHGERKSDPKAMIAGIDAVPLRTAGACGGDVRNIVDAPGPSGARFSSLATILSPSEATTNRGGKNE